MIIKQENIFKKEKHLKTESQLHKRRGQKFRTQIIFFQIGERILKWVNPFNKEEVHRTETYPIIRRRVINHQVSVN
jgi:hypothetical protein